MCKKLVQMVPHTDFGKEVQNSQEGFQLHSLFFFFTCSNANDTGHLSTFLQLTKMTNIYD